MLVSGTPFFLSPDSSSKLLRSRDTHVISRVHDLRERPTKRERRHPARRARRQGALDGVADTSRILHVKGGIQMAKKAKGAKKKAAKKR